MSLGICKEAHREYRQKINHHHHRLLSAFNRRYLTLLGRRFISSLIISSQSRILIIIVIIINHARLPYVLDSNNDTWNIKPPTLPRPAPHCLIHRTVLHTCSQPVFIYCSKPARTLVGSTSCLAYRSTRIAALASPGSAAAEPGINIAFANTGWPSPSIA